MKKFLLTLGLSFLLTTSVGAISTIKIDNISPEDMKFKLLNIFQQSHNNMMVETMEKNNSIYLFTNTTSYGLLNQYTGTIEDRVNFTYTPDGNGTNLSVNITRTVTASTGQRQTYPVNNTSDELAILHHLKVILNGGYFFGFDMDTSKKDGGYPIIQIQKDGAFDKAGIKQGDILVAVNNVKLKYNKKTGQHNWTQDKLYPSTHTFTIIHNGVKKDYTLSSIFNPGQLSNKEAESTEKS